MPVSIGGKIINPILLVVGSAGAYMMFDYMTKSRRKRKIPGTGIYHAYEIGLTEDDFRLPENIEINVKKAQYFPSMYTTLVTKLPLVSAAVAGIVLGDYIMDKIRKKRAKKEYDELQREFDEAMNEAVILAKIKSDIKSASGSLKYASISGAFFGIADTIMNTFVRLFTPDLTHRDIVHLYTYSITPYMAWTSYKATSKDLDTRDKISRAVIAYMQNRTASLPSAAVIPALQESTRIRAMMKAKENQSVARKSLQEKQKLLEQIFSKDISKSPDLGTEYKNRQTLQDIYSETKQEM